LRKGFDDDDVVGLETMSEEVGEDREELVSFRFVDDDLREEPRGTGGCDRKWFWTHFFSVVLMRSSAEELSKGLRLGFVSFFWWVWSV